MANSNLTVAQDVAAHQLNGVLTYAGALQVLEDAAAETMTASLFGQLQSVASDLNVAGGVHASNAVAQLFQDVVLGNAANAQWNGGANAGVALGDLNASSSATQFDRLIDKWFLGQDLPGVETAPGAHGYAAAYETYNLPLFTAGAPQITDVNQGQAGDCWFLSALGETAKLHPGLIKRLITSDGAGVYTVEFQVNGKADYVTVNNQFSTYAGDVAQYDGSQMEYASSSSNLWVSIVEKAAAELSAQGALTGLQYADGANQYYNLDAGQGEGVSLLTGQNTAQFATAGRSAASLTNLLGNMSHYLSAGHDVLLATSNDAINGGNLVAGHMFAVTGVNAATGMVSLYNPWGANAAGEGKAESFSVSAQSLENDGAYFYAAKGAIHV